MTLRAGRLPVCVVLGLHHHRPQEVRRCRVRVVQPELGHPAHVLPQRQPLLGLVPHVGALEQRHHQVLRQVEYIQRRTDVGLHRHS